MNVSTYAKSIVYIVLAAVGFLVTALTDDVLTIEETLNLAVVVLGAVLVYAVRNLPEGWRKYSKAIIAFLIAGIVAVIAALGGGVTLSEWGQIIIAAFTAIGVYIVPNQPATETE